MPPAETLSMISPGMRPGTVADLADGKVIAISDSHCEKTLVVTKKHNSRKMTSISAVICRPWERPRIFFRKFIPPPAPILQKVIQVQQCGAPYGDAVGEIEGFPQKVGPVSTVGGCACLDAMIAETVQLLVDAGQEPPVFMSANMEGGDEFNARMLKKNADRIHYMD